MNHLFINEIFKTEHKKTLKILDKKKTVISLGGGAFGNEDIREKILIEMSKNEKTTILFESPHRLKQLLFELKKTFGGEREIKIFRELTKKFEEHIGNNIQNVIEYFEGKEVIGEITVVIKWINKNGNQIINSCEKSLWIFVA